MRGLKRVPVACRVEGRERRVGDRTGLACILCLHDDAAKEDEAHHTQGDYTKKREMHLDGDQHLGELGETDRRVLYISSGERFETLHVPAVQVRFGTEGGGKNSTSPYLQMA